MNPTERMMVHLLDCAVNERTPDASLLDGVSWEAMFRLAQAHKIDALLLNPICALPEDRQPPLNVLAAWQENAMLTLMGQALLTGELHELLGALEAAGVLAVVLKGIALKPLYPEPDLRTMSDADLLVKTGQYESARGVMAARGLSLAETEPGVEVYASAQGLRVELHERLFDKTAYGFLSRLDEEKMFPIGLARREAVHGGEAWVFPPMQHALFMLCHMAKHMITTGFGLRQAADFSLFVKACDDTMDWPAFWKEARTLGLFEFTSALLWIGAEYLSLPRGAWARGAKADEEAAQELLWDLLDAGVFGNRTEERKRSAAVVYRAYEAKDAGKGRLRRAIFPSAKTLKAPYLYARKHPALLPVAWVHRWVRYALSLLTGQAKHSETAAGIQIADERLRLLDKLGLRDDT